MVTIPAVCLSCGALFPSRFASLFGGTNVNLTLRGNAETCPYCGRLAHVADGVFHIAGDILTVVSAPHITREMLAALSAAVRKAYQDKKPPEEVAQEVEKIDPALGAVIRKNASTPLYWLVLILILAAHRSATGSAAGFGDRTGRTCARTFAFTCGRAPHDDLALCSPFE